MKFVQAIIMCLAIQSYAQVSQPNLPVNLVVDFGYLFPTNNPETLNTRFWGSTVFNIYLSYDMRLGDSRFFFVPGIGLSHERYRFDEGNSLYSQAAGGVAEDVIIGAADTLYGFRGGAIFNNKLFINYLELPLEMQWHLNKENPERGLRIALGGKIGLRVKSQVAFKFNQNDQDKRYAFNEDFNLNLIRYGGFSRIGVGPWNMFFYYNFSPLWISGNAPDGAQNMSQFTIGTSLSLF